MTTLAIVGVIFFVLGYLIPACIEIYDRTRHPRDSADSRVSPFSIRSDWFTAFSALAVNRMRIATRQTLKECETLPVNKHVVGFCNICWVV